MQLGRVAQHHVEMPHTAACLQFVTRTRACQSYISGNAALREVTSVLPDAYPISDFLSALKRLAPSRICTRNDRASTRGAASIIPRTSRPCATPVRPTVDVFYAARYPTYPGRSRRGGAGFCEHDVCSASRSLILRLWDSSTSLANAPPGSQPCNAIRAPLAMSMSEREKSAASSRVTVSRAFFQRRPRT